MKGSNRPAATRYLLRRGCGHDEEGQGGGRL